MSLEELYHELPNFSLQGKRHFRICCGPADVLLLDLQSRANSAAVQWRLDLTGRASWLPSEQQHHIQYKKLECHNTIPVFITILHHQHCSSNVFIVTGELCKSLFLYYVPLKLRTGKQSMRSCRSPAAMLSRTRPPVIVWRSVWWQLMLGAAAPPSPSQRLSWWRRLPVRSADREQNRI